MARTRTGEIAGAPSPSSMTTTMGDGGMWGQVQTGYGRTGECDGPAPGNMSVPTYLTPTSPFQRMGEIPGAPRP